MGLRIDKIAHRSHQTKKREVLILPVPFGLVQIMHRGPGLRRRSPNRPATPCRNEAPKPRRDAHDARDLNRFHLCRGDD